MTGFGVVGRFAVGTFDHAGGNVTLSITSGSLTLTGRSVALVPSLTITKADLTLSGNTVTLPVIEGVGSGSLTLTGRDTSLVTSATITKADLTLTPSVVGLIFSGETIADTDLTLTAYAVPLNLTFGIQHATIALTGRNVTIGHSIPIEAGRLTLTPHNVDLLPIGGSSGRRKKGRTGFEPIKKDFRPRKPEPEPKVWTPPTVKAPPIAPSRPAPELVDPDLVPDGLLAIQQQMRDAEDISAISRMIEARDYDEQDAADIADVLALLD